MNTAAAGLRAALPYASPRPCRILFAAACVLTFFFIASWAWVSDDAYITFRVVDNAVHGYGLRWNIDERVQAYTHPLWMLIHIPFYYVYRNIFLLNIALSAAFAAAAVTVAMRSIDASLLHKACLILLPLALSKAFRNHIINGLEAPLMLFLLACFWHSFLRAPQRMYRLLFITSLVMLTRLDGIVVTCLPVLWRLSNLRFRDFSIPRAMAATSPITGWLAFCLVYYGFLFPNTKYAKLNSGFTTSDYVQQGWHYLEQFRIFDYFGYLCIVLSLICAVGFVLHTFAKRLTDKRTDTAPFVIAPLMATSILLQIAYVIRIGGDFMNGRFFVTPFFLSLILVYYCLSHIRPLALAFIASAMLAIAYSRYNFDREHGYINQYGIYDERHYYAWKQALFKKGGFISNTLNGAFFAKGPNVIRRQPNDTKVKLNWDIPEDWQAHKKVIQTGYIGVLGYAADPRLIIVDSLGLADPLIARLPCIPFESHVGHYLRAIPKGYMYARSTGDMSQMAPPLHAYYTKLNLVTSGDLWSLERFKTIAAFQLGEYNDLRKQYVTGSK